MKIAITGGIGSGKSFVCRRLELQGVSVYDCDDGAKRLMRSSTSIQQALSRLVGEDVYAGGQLQKAVLARYIVASKENAQKVDDIVHPAVASDFLRSGLDWLESAILFESHFAERLNLDRVVCVVAPLEVRLMRVMQRDGISRQRAMEWIEGQMPQEEKALMSDYVINNDGKASVDVQIRNILNEINKK